MEQLSGKKILVTGVTGWMAGPVASDLAKDNEVYGAARFKDASQREPLEAAGVHTISVDLGEGRFDEVPADLDHVLHFAVSKVPSWADAFAARIQEAGWSATNVTRAKGNIVEFDSPVNYEAGSGTWEDWALTVGYYGSPMNPGTLDGRRAIPSY